MVLKLLHFELHLHSAYLPTARSRGTVAARVQSVVVGAGVLGLAVARSLARAGREVLVLEASSAVGSVTSSRNSGVIHAGIYYPQGSLKARLCVQGKQQLYRYCDARGIGHRRCGKLIVATSAAQLPQLEAIRRANAYVYIENAYFADDRILYELCRARRRGGGGRPAVGRGAGAAGAAAAAVL